MNEPTVPEVLGPASVVAEPVVTQGASEHGRLNRGAIAWSVFEGGRDPYVILITIYIFMPYVSATLVGDPVRGQELIARYAQYAGWIVMLTGPLLGAADNPTYGTATIRLTTSDVLLLYTDGLIEHRNRTIAEGFAPVLHEAVLGGQIDVAVLNGAVRGIDLVMEPLLREQMCLIGPAKDKRLKAASISVRHLDGLPLVMTGLAKSGVRLELEAAAARAGVALESVVEVESVDVARRLVLAGVGLTVHFAAVVHDDLQRKRLAAVPIEGLFLNRVIARAAGRPPSRATEALTGVLREVVTEEVRSGRWPYATPDASDNASRSAPPASA